MTRSLTLPVVAILTSCALLPAYAAGVHKWVDAKGATHYSDEAPTSATAVVTLIKVPTTRSATADAANDYYSIANQWQRLHKERLEREKIKLAKAKQKSTQQQAPPRYVYIKEPKETRYVAAFPGFSHYKYGHRRMHKRFHHFYGSGGNNRLRGHRRTGLRRQQISLGSYRHVE
jgi:hypothetical protein